jgi:uncharacterized protein
MMQHRKVLIVNGMKIFCLIYGMIFLTTWSLQDKLLLHPVALPLNFKFQSNIKFEEHFVKISRLDSLNVLHFQTKLPRKGVVLYLHGNADNLDRWSKHASQFVDRGYDIIFYDYRGFGKSTGKTTEANLLTDANLMYMFVKEELNFPENQIIVYGRSLGTGPSVRLSFDFKPKFLILETPYSSIPDAASRLIPFIPFEKISDYQLNSLDIIDKINCDVHFFHGTKDWVVKYESGKQLAAKSRGGLQNLTTIEGGGHKNLEKFKQYQHKMDELLK